jgi:hypothetical protein
MSGQVIRQAERTAARKADGERRERVVGVQQRLVGHARLARMAGAVLPAGGRCPGPRRRGWRSVSGHRRALRACGPRGEDFETLLAAVRDAAN